MAKPSSKLTYKPRKKIPVFPLTLAALLTGVCVFFVVDHLRSGNESDNMQLSLPMQDTSMQGQSSSTGEEPSLFEQLTGHNRSPFDTALQDALESYQLGDFNKATSKLVTLADQHPDRPEPLNNLAVIYAEQGKQQQAIDTLQKAFNTNPAYASVYQNLSDIYAALAADAYNKALGISGNEAGIKLSMINSGHAMQKSKMATAASQPQPISVDPVTTHSQTSALPSVSKPLVVATASPEPIPVTITPTPTLNSQATTPYQPTLPLAREGNQDNEYTNTLLSPLDTETIIAAQRSEVVSDPNQPTAEELRLSAEEKAIAEETARASQLLREIAAGAVVNENNAPKDISHTLPTEAPSDIPEPSVNPEDQVRMLVNQWATAWSEQDVGTYINSYVNNYTPRADSTHRAWADLRRSRITRPQFIRVRLNEMLVDMIGENRAVVTFTQHYTADHYSDVESKQLEIVNTGDGWKIKTESKL